MMIEGNFAIALDGPAGSGKSTIAKRLAKRLGIAYIDTGAMYRAVGLYCTDRNIALDDEKQVLEALQEMQLEIRMDGGSQRMHLQGEDVSERIRTPEAGKGASVVAAILPVREYLVKRQRELAKGMPVVMDGRDIGTNVLPDAKVKIYLTASAEERAKRRMLDFSAMGERVDFEEVKRQIEDRDYQDMHREHNPLKKAADAMELDTTGLEIAEVEEKIITIVKQRCE